MGSVNVLLFATAREKAGTATLSVEVGEGVNALGEFRERLAKACPAVADVAAHSRIAVNRTFAGPETRIQPGDEVAVIPPVSGG